MARNKKAKKTLLVGRIIACILILISAAFVTAITLCDVLPFKYLIILQAGLFGFVFLNSWFLFSKKFRIWLKSIAIFFSLLVIFILSVGLIYIQKTYNFMDKIKYRGYITEKYYVLVNNESTYTDIKELSNKKIGTFVEKIELYDEAIKKLKESIGEVETIEYKNAIELDEENNEIVKKNGLISFEDVDTMSRKLMRNEIDAIIISEAHKETMETDLEEFTSKVKVLQEIEIKVKKENQLEHPNVNVKKEAFTIFLAGSDSRGSISKRSNCDVNMVITVNPNTYEILMVSIPRDYYVQLHGTTGYKDKLTHAGYYGVDMSINTIQDLMGIKIDYYVKVGFSTVEKLVDTIGGVDVYSDKTFVPLHGGGRTIKQGINHMDGSLALAFARERKTYSGGDRHRIQNQQDVLSAIIKKMTDSKELLLKYTSILDALADCFETNLSSKDITNLVNLQLDKMPKWNIKTYNLNGFDSSGYTYSYGNRELWVMQPNYDTVKQGADYINGIRQRKSFSELGIE